MKKTILVVLMTMMISATCFAQEVEPEGLFSVEGTAWGWCGIGVGSLLPFIGIGCSYISFYQGKVYFCDNPNDCAAIDSLVIDLGVVSIAYTYYVGPFLAILQPIGLGVGSWVIFRPGGCRPGIPMICWPPFFGYQIGIMYKINDNWTPPGIE